MNNYYFDIFFFNKIFSYSHLLCKNLWFITATKSALSCYNFNKFLSFRINFFIYILIYCPAVMRTSNTSSLCLLQEHNFFVNWRGTWLNINIFYFKLSIFRKNKIVFCITVYIIFAEQYLSLVAGSGEIESIILT